MFQGVYGALLSRSMLNSAKLVHQILTGAILPVTSLQALSIAKEAQKSIGLLVVVSSFMSSSV